MDYIATLESYIIEDVFTFEAFGEGRHTDEKFFAFLKRKIVELFHWIAEKWRRFVERVKGFFGKSKSKATAEENTELKKQIAEKDAKIKDLEARIRDTKATMSANKEKSDAQDQQLQNMSEMLDKIEEDRKKLEAQLNKSKAASAESEQAYKIGKRMGELMDSMLNSRTKRLTNLIQETTRAVQKVAAAISSGNEPILDDWKTLPLQRKFAAGDEDQDGEPYINDAKEDLLALMKKVGGEDYNYEATAQIRRRFAEGFSASGSNASETIAKSGKLRLELEKALKMLQNLKPTTDNQIKTVKLVLDGAAYATADWDRCNRVYLNAIGFVNSVKQGIKFRGLQSEL